MPETPRAFSVGDRVAVIHHPADGEIALEAWAEVVGSAEKPGEYVVRFADGSEATRFVDPAAQRDPGLYVAQLNSALRSVAADGATRKPRKRRAG